MKLETGKFRQRIDSDFQTRTGFAYYDGQGERLCHCGLSAEEAGIALAVTPAMQNAVADSADAPIFSDRPAQGIGRLTLPVCLSGSEYYLQALYQAPQSRSEVETALAVALMAIADISSLNHELDDMADDLTARYEELNLFYGLDELVEIKDITRGRKALHSLAENCIRYLNIKVASIYITSADIDAKAYSGEAPAFPPKFAEKVRYMRARLLEKLSGTRESLIVNDADFISNMSDGMLKYKIAATPVFSGAGEVLGYLLLQRLPDAPDFTNSDLRLMRVLAEQAAAIASSSYDAVTGLLNREGLIGPLNSAIQEVRDRGDKRCLLIMDIDQFRLINDTAGREAGDELLRQFALHLRSMCPDEPVLSRLEADKFAWVVRIGEIRDAWLAASTATRSLSETGFRYGSKIFDVSVSAGIVELHDEIADANEALVLGTIACDVAKKQGAGGIFIYDPSSPAVASVRNAIDWVPHIRTALDQNAFEIYGQEITPLDKADPNAVHYELLLRLRGEDGTVGSPFQLINAAEIYNLMSRIDQWVFEHALLKLAALQQEYPDLNLRFSINMSGQSVTDDFFAFLRRLLMDSPALIPSINIEITETAVVSNLATATRLIQSLRDIGVTFSLDDFGTGMSSFGYLRDLPIDYLKIDGTFVKHIADDPVSRAMVESINNVGHIMGLRTVAEFVENDAILNELRRLGVDYAQGYALSKPAPIREQIAAFHRRLQCPDSLNRLTG
ncbi:EAL domain-containing protein [Granulosicoccaceae sp. 1_MG-2023]|nr:EAL domain-containing protein [Granulosicoccaceae sp. 1_MG-2023]